MGNEIHGGQLPLTRLNRLVAWAHKPDSPSFIRFFLKVLLHLELPLTPEVRAICLPHPWGVIIHPHASVGVNVTIYQGVTIGRKNTGRKAGIPTIGNNVTIWPNAVVIGGIVIGDGATVGAGAIVINDVPPNAVVAGNPARILSRDQ